jgi:hypothetical protein
MSIIDSNDNLLRKGRAHRGGEEAVDGSILDLDVLRTTIKDFMSEKQIDPEERGRVAGFRHRDHVERFGIADLLGHVDLDGFKFMLESMLKHQLKTITNSQNNGDWRVLDFDVDVRTIGTVRNLLVGVRWVDVSNQRDLQYSNGQPSINVTVENNSGDTQALLNALKEQRSGSDPELKELIKLLAAKLLADSDKPKTTKRGAAPVDEDPL